MAKKFNLELTEQQFNVVVEAMQFHACNLDQEVRNQSDPNSQYYHCTGKENIKPMANELKVARNVIEKLLGDRYVY
tara:strand:- start:39 stop:266 length:228 start_codon:yes stop_codon:yes gene_type:complete